MPPSVYFLSISFVSSTTRCSRLILYFPYLSPGTSHFPKEPWFLLIRVVFRNKNLGAGGLIATGVSLLLGPLGDRAGFALIKKKIKFPLLPFVEKFQTGAHQPLNTDPSLQPAACSLSNPTCPQRALCLLGLQGKEHLRSPPPIRSHFLCVLLLTSGAFVAQLLWERDSGLASGALAAQIALGLQACSLLDGQLCYGWWQ